MNHSFQDLMRDAARLTRAGQLGAATDAIQRALRGAASPDTSPQTRSPHDLFQDAAQTLAFKLPVIEVEGRVVDMTDFVPVAPPSDVPHVAKTPVDRTPAQPAPSPTAGEFSHGSHTLAGLTRHYKLYVPPGPAGRSLPLVVMLHGCTQDPDDFAAGTGMNALASEQGFYVLYPAQAQDANPSRCWNWFKHNHQARDHGETALIAAMTQAVIEAHGIDPDRVYIAGLSAGGAMASLVAAAYPDVFAAVGVHSGLPPGAASSLPEGLAAMQAGSGAAAGRSPLQPGLNTGLRFKAKARPPAGLAVPVIVFHGDQDQTVHPLNGEQVVAAALKGSRRTGVSADGRPVVEQGVCAAGRRYTRSTYAAESGPAIAEHWLVHGAGHAWSGGQPGGSYTDVHGPDATREMLRFFFSCKRAAAPSAHQAAP
jgi:poly(hydroxyalkanoate) depolymerase family esterase